MDIPALGERIALARARAGLSQESLGTAVGLDRSAISRLEKGERKVSVPELVDIAGFLGRPLAYFVADPVPAVVSRRRDSEHAHDSTWELDDEIAQLASDVRFLLQMHVLDTVDRSTLPGRSPRNHTDAEQLALAVRAAIGLAAEPVGDLGRACESLGLLVYAAPLGEDGADGACVEVLHDAGALGVAVVNGQAPPGRRRMTLAHELGHWLAGDAYDSEASIENEQMLNSFAIHFLAPRSGVQRVWRENPGRDARSQALVVSATFRLSWKAAVSQLRNLDLITYEEHDSLRRNTPLRGDFARLGLSWHDELAPPYLSPGLVAGVVRAYAEHRLTPERAVELLRGTLDAEDLPAVEPISVEHTRRAFDGHGSEPG